MLIPVIMAGGNGSRLWPMSRHSTPKQFLSLTGDDSLLQQTIERLRPLQHGSPIIVTNSEHRFLVAEQLREISVTAHDIILEPVSRNTAPAVALAAIAAKRETDPVLLVLAADHHFENPAALIEAINKGMQLAEQGLMVTFGIKPTRPETGFGYIHRGEALSEAGHRIDRFVEKPDLATATDYVSSGNYLWNSGMFMFRASRYLEELQKHHPEILTACEQAIGSATRDLDFVRLDHDLFAASPDDSIDYAVMEKTDAAAVVELDAGWSDVGSWQALWEVNEKDENDNVCQGDVITVDSHGSFISAQHRLVTTLGVQDLIVVETKDAVLVADKGQSQNVKAIVDQLKSAQRSEYITHPHVPRPWGEFDTIDSGDRYQVKRITVNPGQRLSLQLHYHRAEHWIVVSGTARVVCGDKEQILTENQSTYIPLGVKHSLENPGKVPLELIEVQSGNYLGEDDIVRFEDMYGRCPP
ncbi:mannose-1-phosphate guanylyltransferase/mannose-6-phosphate isomerase [Nitrincola alkalilacustris]|uniref:mannose-1-phosphate guanylyltransferase/mannose-6-phosphate isomerase n=1 Tax=Nitrincola alkalilacustris TaxID=1571224 RepID=UPI00124DAFA2|nr:mannose-1-phosphate guanylyltransferase/mannose-6-phosphate isomerase [Nitrincola alkalilacustris]